MVKASPHLPASLTPKKNYPLRRRIPASVTTFEKRPPFLSPPRLKPPSELNYRSVNVIVYLRVTEFNDFTVATVSALEIVRGSLGAEQCL